MKSSIAIIILLFLSLIFAEKNKVSAKIEFNEKDNLLLELKKITLDEEIKQFEKDRKEWEKKKLAEYEIKHFESFNEEMLNRKAYIKNIINDQISKTFSKFLFENGRDSENFKFIILSIIINSDGQVIKTVINKSNIKPKLEKEIIEIAEELEFTKLKGEFNEKTHTFPLLIKEK